MTRTSIYQMMKEIKERAPSRFAEMCGYGFDLELDYTERGFSYRYTSNNEILHSGGVQAENAGELVKKIKQLNQDLADLGVPAPRITGELPPEYKLEEMVEK